MNDLEICRVNQCDTFAFESVAQETVRDRGMVPKDHQQEMAYGESNGHVNNDVAWLDPESSGQTTPNMLIDGRPHLDNSWRWYLA